MPQIAHSSMFTQAKIKKALLTAMLIVLNAAPIFWLSSCTPVKPVISVDYTVHLKDPLFQKLARATEVLDLKAHGTLKSGSYTAHGVPVHLGQDTNFDLTIALPVNGSADINISTAKGSLSFDHPISILNVPAPQKIELSNGAVSANVDFARLVCIFVLNCLQESAGAVSAAQGQQAASASEVQSMLKDFHIEHALFKIKEGSSLEFEQCQCAFGPKSTVSFDHLDFNERLDYSGHCHADVHFNTLSARDTANNRTVVTTGSQAILDLNVSRQSGVMKCLLDTSVPGSFTASHAKLTDKRGTIEFDACSIALSKFELIRPTKDTSNLAFAGNLSCSNASGKLNRNNTSVDLIVPSMKDASITFSKQNGTTTYQFQADNLNAQNINVAAQRARGKFSLSLKQAQLDQLTLSKSGGLSINFDKGVCQPTSALVENGKGQRVSIQFAPSSTVSLNDFGLNSDDADKDTSAQSKPSTTLQKVPLTIKSGALTISSGTNKFQCRQLNGSITIGLDEKTVEADGKLKIDVTSDQNPLGIRGAHAVINALELHHNENGTQLKLSDCLIALSNADLRAALQNNLPKEKAFNINKLVMDERKWRYKNLRLTNVFVRNPSVNKLAISPKGAIQVGADADVKAEGTVDRFELHPLQEIKRQWNTHPWSAQGHVTGTGDVAFKFVPGKSLADSTVEYQAQCKLPVPDNLTIDWSQVAGDILAGAEMRLVQRVIKNANYFLPDKGIPLEFSGKIEPFKQRADRSLRQVSVKKFALKNTKDGIGILLDADMNL